jgi:hypothetical protein
LYCDDLQTDERGFIATIVCEPGTGQGEYWAEIIQDTRKNWTLQDLIMELESEGHLHLYGDFPPGVGVVEQVTKELRADH